MNQEFDFPSFKKSFHFLYFSFEERSKKIEWEPFSLGVYCVENYCQETVDWRLKIFRISDKKKQERFSKYLSQVIDFSELEKYSFKTNFLSHIIGYSSNEEKEFKEFYIVQQNQKPQRLIKNLKDKMSEIECLGLIRSIVTLYSHLFSEEELLENLRELGVYVIDPNEMFYYRKFRDEIKSKKLPSFKLKFDFFNFLNNKLDKTIDRLHFADLKAFIQQFEFPRMGISLQFFKNRLENYEDLNWKLIFKNPMFLQSIEGKIDWHFWKITEEEKEKLSLELFKTIKTQKKIPVLIKGFLSLTEVNEGKKGKKTKNEFLSSSERNKEKEEEKEMGKKKPIKVKTKNDDKPGSEKIISPQSPNKSPEFKKSSFYKPLMKKKTIDLEKKQALLNQIKKFLKSSYFQAKRHIYIKKEEEEFLEGWIHANLEILVQKRPQTLESNQHVERVKQIYQDNPKKFNIREILKKLPEKSDSQRLVSPEDYDLLF